MSESNQTLQSVTQIESQPLINLIIQDSSGSVLGLYGGSSRMLADLFATASQDTDRGVEEVSNSFIQPGQTVYRITLEYLKSVLGACIFLSAKEAASLPDQIPSDSKLTVVVSF